MASLIKRFIIQDGLVLLPSHIWSLLPPNIAVERDRPKAALWCPLRGFAAPAAPHLAR